MKSYLLENFLPSVSRHTSGIYQQCQSPQKMDLFCVFPFTWDQSADTISYYMKPTSRLNNFILLVKKGSFNSLFENFVKSFILVIPSALQTLHCSVMLLSKLLGNQNLPDFFSILNYKTCRFLIYTWISEKMKPNDLYMGSERNLKTIFRQCVGCLLVL